MTVEAVSCTMRDETVPECLLCGTKGLPLYQHLVDRLYDVAGSYGFLHCPSCSFVWLSPRPHPDDLVHCYPSSYEAHEFPAQRRPTPRKAQHLRDLLRQLILSEGYGYHHFRHPAWWASPMGKFLAAVPWLSAQARFGYDDLCPPFVQGGICLDVGCGPGHYLAHMRALGWAVMGVDLSPHAAHVAQTAHGIDVRVGTLAQANFPDNHFAVVTMSHAIEHMPNPLTELRECFRILRPNGCLVLITPNAAGLMSRLFGPHWVSLDPPRHLSMFTAPTLRRFVESVGFLVERVRTRPRLSRFDYEKSLRIRRVGSAKDHVGSNAVGSAARVCTLAEQALLAIWPWAGNELMLSAVKR